MENTAYHDTKKGYVALATYGRVALISICRANAHMVYGLKYHT